MKPLPFLIALTLCYAACQPAPTSTADTTASTPPSTTSLFDAALAEQYGADDYGMHQYVIAFLKSGPTPAPDSTTRAQIQAAHMANIRRMAEEGKLLIAGPFMDDTELRGIYIFDVQSIEEAEALTRTDPAIQAGTLAMELHPWYGPAALMAIPELTPKLKKKEI